MDRLIGRAKLAWRPRGRYLDVWRGPVSIGTAEALELRSALRHTKEALAQRQGTDRFELAGLRGQRSCMRK